MGCMNNLSFVTCLSLFSCLLSCRLRGVYDPCPSTPQHEKHVYLEYTLGGEAFEKTFEIDQPIIVP